jgi:hypothetical protein
VSGDSFTPLQLFFLRRYSPGQALAASMKLSVSLQLLDLGLLVRVINSSQGHYLHTNTEKRNHNANTKHLCPDWASEDSSCFRPLGYPDRLASERAKTVHASDRSATLTGLLPLYPRKDARCSHWMGSWMAPKSSLVAVEKRETLALPGI